MSRRGPRRGPRRRLGAATTAAVVWLTVVAMAALSASWLPLDPNRQDLRNGLAAPSWAHPFGTTRLGEDLLARVVHGSRVSLVVGLVATLTGLLLGGVVGMAAGLLRRWFDAAVVVLIDAAAAFPPLVLAMSMVLIRGPGLTTITATIALLTVPLFARVARTATLGVVHHDFMLAARAAGAPTRRLLSHEVLPNVVVPLAGYAFVVAGLAMLVEGALSFLGVGVGTDKTSWGQLVAAGQGALASAPHLSLFPAATLFLTVTALSQLGDQLSTRWMGAAPAARRRRRHEPAPPAAPVEPAPPAATLASIAPSEPTEPARLEVRHLRTVLHTAAGDLAVVQDVSFTLRAGELLGLVGESGSGKSMLARSLVGLTPYGTPAAITGSVRLDGVDLLRLEGAALRAQRGAGIAQVLQDPMTSLDPVMRVGRQIALLAQHHRGLDRRAADALAIELLERVGVGEAAQRARRFPHELSGGLRQRVAVAQALAADPRVLVADEATSAVDVTTQRLLVDLLDELRRAHDLAVLLISHDLTLLAQRADRIAVLYAGRLVEVAAADRLYRTPRMPYSAGLLAAAPRLEDPPHTRLAVIPGAPPTPGSVERGCAFAARCARVGPRCEAEVPALAPIGEADHQVACFHPLEPADRSG